MLAAIERLGCPVLTTYQAVGVVPEGHPQLAGLFTSGLIETSLLFEADLIVTIGFDQVEPMPAAWRYEVPVVALSEVAACATLVPITIEVVGPLADDAGASVITTRVPDGLTIPARRAVERRARWLPPPPAASARSSSRRPLPQLRHEQAIATVDAGAHFLSMMPFWPATEPLQLLISNGLATMGFALPAAIAAALARPGRPVVCMVGDGGLAMTLAELETLARLRLPVTVVVFDDAALSLIEVKQKPGQGGSEAVRFAAGRLRAGRRRRWARCGRRHDGGGGCCGLGATAGIARV